MELREKFEGAKTITDSKTVVTESDTELLRNFLSAVENLDTALRVIQDRVDSAWTEVILGRTGVGTLVQRNGSLVHDIGLVLMHRFV